MTPLATQILLGLIALLVLVLLVRIARRWYLDRQALTLAERSPYRHDRSRPVGEPAAAAPSQTLAEPEYASILRADESLPPVSPLQAASMAADSAAANWAEPAEYHPRGASRFGPSLPAPDSNHRYEAVDMPFADRSDYSFGPATPLLAAMLPESEEKKRALTRNLKNAGYYTPHAWHNLAATRYVGMVLPILVFGALLVMVPSRFELPIIGCLVGCSILGYALPGLLVQSQAAERIREIEQGMPDMLDMLNMCVSQGMTLPNSLHRVGNELRGVYPDLAKELAIVSDQARIAGLPQALQSMADRIDNPDVHSFTSLLMQTEQMGTSVSDALAGYAENMREGLKQRADLKGNSATFKLLFPTVFCLMPAVFLFLLGPAVVQLHEFYTRGGTDVLRAGADATLNAQE